MDKQHLTDTNENWCILPMQLMHLHAVTSIERLVSPGPWNLRQFRDSLKDHNGDVLKAIRENNYDKVIELLENEF